jgi:radical SAM superfamily enzyme YgiQ (UPF0313 family)
MHVALIAPTALDMTGRPVKQRRIHLPALTLYALAAVTPPDVKLRLINETVEDVPYDGPWDLVGLTGMGCGVVRAWQIADEFRRRGRRVVMGGIPVSLGKPEWTLAHADALVVGEAEELWPQVLRDAQAGSLQPVYRSEGPPDMGSFPVPRYDLLDRAKHGRWTPVQATRGCPLGCRFCSVTAFHHQRYRKRPVAQVIRDVRAAKQHGSHYITLVDDNIGLDWEYCAELWTALIPEKLTWMSQCTIRIADRPDMVELARRSGCRVLCCGIESTDPNSLKTIGKEWNRPERYREAIGTLRAHGVDLSTEMIIGLDEDDASVFDRTYEFIMENRISLPRIHILTPIPGTPLFEGMSRQGRILSEDFSRYSGGQVVFRPCRIEPAVLQAEYWKLYERLFSWSAIRHRLQKNLAWSDTYLAALVFCANVHYRRHIRRRIVPGII